eukprot:5872417-Amphidinium_carterae.1
MAKIREDTGFERSVACKDSSTKQLEEMNREMRALEQRVQKEREQQRVAMQAIEGSTRLLTACIMKPPTS